MKFRVSNIRNDQVEEIEAAYYNLILDGTWFQFMGVENTVIATLRAEDVERIDLVQ